MNLKSISLLFVSSALSISLVNGQEQLRTLSHNNGSIFESFRNQKVSADINSTKLVSLLGLSEGNSFVMVGTHTDALGFEHANFQQYFNDVLVEGAMIKTHAKNGFLQAINGEFLNISSLSVHAAIDEQRANSIAETNLGITEVFRNYAPIAKVIMDPQTGTPVFTYDVRVDGKNENGFIIMKRVFVNAHTGAVVDLEQVNAHADVPGVGHTYLSGPRPITTNFDGNGTYRLLDSARNIHTLDASAAEVGNTTAIFTNPKEFTNNSTEWGKKLAITRTRLDAVANGGIFQNLGNTRRVFGAVGTGTMPAIDLASWPAIVSSSSTPVNARAHYHYIDTAQPTYGIFGKVNTQNFTVTDTVIFPIDSFHTGNHPWEDSIGNRGIYVIDSVNNPALDVHWGIGKTYDYYIAKFNRNSFDGQGAKIVNYVNGIFPFADGSNSNAMAMQAPYNLMMYGMGDGLYTNPFVSLDVTGHEFTHLVISRNGSNGLRYRGESGALNESFADIFGVSIDFYAHDTTANWLIGEEIYLGSNFMRSMAEPKLRQNPDTYKGQFWINTSSNQDNGGVHYNSGVQNYWYYLLVNGGSGTNDNGYQYNVTGIGLDKAEQIAYRNLMNYLTYNAGYQAAFDGSLQATIDLFGADTTSAEYQAVKEAWFAVGLGEGGPVSTSVKNTNTLNDLVQVFPNPAQAQFTIKSDLNETVEAVMYNNLGQAVRNISLKNGQNKIDASGLNKGMYHIIFNVSGKRYAHKVTLL